MLHYLTGWLTGCLELFGGGREVWKGREGVEERGQGCFLFSQLIDSQMSGGVGFAAGAGVLWDTFAFHKQTQHLCTCKYGSCISAHAQACTCTPVSQ